MQVTTPSTSSDDQQRARRLPPDLLHRTNVLLNENDSLQAELEHLRAEVQRLTPDHAHARQCRTDDIERLVLKALENVKLLAAVMDATRCRRTEIVRGHLRALKERYKILKPPTHDSVKKALIKYGYV